MADPTSATTIPHLLGIILSGNGVAYTKVFALNRRTGESQIKATNEYKTVIFDAAGFTSGYNAEDVIEFTNSGGSVGTATITINSATGGFQDTTMTCAAAPTVSIKL